MYHLIAAALMSSAQPSLASDWSFDTPTNEEFCTRALVYHEDMIARLGDFQIERNVVRDFLYRYTDQERVGPARTQVIVRECDARFRVYYDRRAAAEEWRVPQWRRSMATR